MKKVFLVIICFLLLSASAVHAWFGTSEFGEGPFGESGFGINAPDRLLLDDGASNLLLDDGTSVLLISQ